MIDLLDDLSPILDRIEIASGFWRHHALDVLIVFQETESALWPWGVLGQLFDLVFILGNIVCISRQLNRVKSTETTSYNPVSLS